MNIGRIIVFVVLILVIAGLIHEIKTDLHVKMYRQLQGVWVNDKEGVTFEFKNIFTSTTPIVVTTKEETIIGDVVIIDEDRIRVNFVERGFFNKERKTEIFNVDMAANTLILQSGPDKIILRRIPKNNV